MGNIPTSPRRKKGSTVATAAFVLLVALLATVAIVAITGDDDVIEAGTTSVTTTPVTTIDPAVPTTTGVNVNTLPWTRQTTQSGRYSIELPADAQAKSIPLTGYAGKTETVYTLFSGNGPIETASTGIGVFEISIDTEGYEFSDSETNEIVDATVGGMFSDRGGQVTESHRVDSDVGPAKRFSGEYLGGIVVAGWVGFDGSTIIMVVMLAPPQGKVIAEESVDRALRTLQSG